MQSDALQHIDQISVRVDTLQAAGQHEALEESQLLSTQLGPTKQVILSSHGNNPQSTFQMVGIHRHMGITEKDLQFRLPLADGVQAFRFHFILFTVQRPVICPLTTWEMALRAKAGNTTYSGSFIAHWLQTLLYYDAPAWVFVVCYTRFGLLVVGSWFWVRARRFGN